MSAGASSGQGDTRFERSGGATTSSFRELTPQQTGLFNQGFEASAPGDASKSVDGFLQRGMRRTTADTPYQPELCNLIRSNMPNVAQPGQSALQGQAGVDVNSGAYADQTFNRYANEVQKAMGIARSGPGATRGGTAAQGFAQSEAVNDLGRNREDMLVRNRQADAGIVQGAAGALTQGRHAMNADAMGGVGASHANFYNLLQSQDREAGMTSERVKMFNDLIPQFTTLASTMKGTENNNLHGMGAQTSSSMGASMNLCCFIFLESYNGELPWYVRAYRDKHAPDNSRRRVGYIRMSKWLVPAMRVGWLPRVLTNCLLVKPLSWYGKWWCGASKWGWVMAPVKAFWFGVWNLTGK